jgi:hypothetical protein
MGDSIPIVADIPQADPRLGFAEYAEALSDAIRGGTPPQFTIGIYGPWGSGKSSLLNAIHRELIQGEDVLPVFFDAWRYERSEYIVVPLLHAIYSETLKLEDKRVAQYFKQALTSLIYSLNFKLGIVELDLEKFRNSNEAVSLVPLDDAFARPFDDLRKVPHALGNRRIVVLIDDLDRCSPENVVAVLESINLVMDIPGFIFVLALDYDVLVRAVSYKYPHVSGHVLIEKMVQVPFRVPRLDLDPDTFARELIPDWFGRQARLPKSFFRYAIDISSLALQSNPRQIKRFINSFLVLRRIISRRGQAPNDIMLAALIGLQLRWPEQYREFSDAVYADDDNPQRLLEGGEDEPALGAYARRFFGDRASGRELKSLLQFTEAVAVTEDAASQSGVSQVRERNRDAFIAQLEQRGFAKSPRSNRLYYHPNTPSVRFAIGKTHIRFEKRNDRGGFDLWESYLITRETDAALAVIDQPDRHFTDRR